LFWWIFLCPSKKSTLLFPAVDKIFSWCVVKISSP
jgi:hypothetical protein